MVIKQQCNECLRVFDLADEDEANEFFYGHDCEPIDITEEEK